MNREQRIQELRDRYRLLNRSLNERQRRLWAAHRALELGRGGISLVSEALRISPNTIRKGMHEIASLPAEDLSQSPVRIRKPGGGRKSRRSAPDHSQSSQSGELSDERPEDNELLPDTGEI